MNFNLDRFLDLHTKGIFEDAFYEVLDIPSIKLKPKHMKDKKTISNNTKKEGYHVSASIKV